MKNFIKSTIDRIRRKPLLVKPVVIGRFGYAEIVTAQNKIKEVKSMYNKHLHGWQYEAQINHTANKMQEILDVFTACKCDACKSVLHKSDCAVHNEPANKNGNCDCGAVNAL